MTTLRDVPAVILAGGLGERLRRAVPDCPKALAPVHGRPFLAYVLDQLAATPLRRAVLLTCYRADDIERAFGPRYASLQLDYVRETTPLGTGGALRQVLDVIEAPAFLVLNADSWCGVDLSKLWAFHVRSCAEMTLATVRVPDASRFGALQFSRLGLITRFVEKARTAAAGWINAGVYAIARHLLAELPPGRATSLERDWLPPWAISKTMLAYPTTGEFLDIGTPESYAEAETFFARQASAGRHAEGRHAVPA